MCGICGFHGRGERSILDAMAAALSHRGPDGQGTFVDDDLRVYLGHRRLAVVDLPGGEQPMWNEDGRVGVVFNGEIYNHAELRAELVEAGHVFASHHSDTEVLVHGYEEWGDGLVERLNGMFAFAVLDRSAKQLFLARDPFGEKPLYYTHERGLFAFSSELTSLLRHPDTDRELDKLSLQKFFGYGFIPAPRTHYRRIAKLAGGHWLRLDLSSGQLELRCYWDFRIEPMDPPPDPEQRWGEELRHLLSEAVRRRLMADVPLGVFLSGGIDSSAVLAVAAGHLDNEQIQSFSIGFQQSSFDESAYAQEAARSIGSKHHQQVIDLDMAKSLLPRVLGHLDEPMGDSSILPTFLVSEYARQKVTVALSGDGGDELFAGYDPFKALQAAELYRRFVPKPVHAALRALAGMLPLSNRNMSLDFKLTRALRGVSYERSLWNPIWLGALAPDEIGELFDESLDLEEIYSEALEAWDNSPSEHVVDKTLEFYTKLYLQDNILTKTDRASMMVSLEARAPFLDRDLVDFARKIPHQYKLRNGETKFLLKRAFAPLLPKRILSRKKKGFGIPLSKWLREMPDTARPRTLPFMNEQWLMSRWKDHCGYRADYRHCLWNCLALSYNLAAQDALP